MPIGGGGGSGGGMAVGAPVTGGTNSTVLFKDSSGNLGSNAGLTFNGGNLVTTVGVIQVKQNSNLYASFANSGYTTVGLDGGGNLQQGSLLWTATTGWTMTAGDGTGTPIALTVLGTIKATNVNTLNDANVEMNASNFLESDTKMLAPSFTGQNFLPAGTAAANTAPMKFISGTLNTAPEVGAMEFLTDKWYGVITTGVARKEFTLNNISFSTLTNSIPFVTTNGRLTADANFWYDPGTGLLAVSNLSVSNTTTVDTLQVNSGMTGALSGAFSGSFTGDAALGATSINTLIFTDGSLLGGYIYSDSVGNVSAKLIIDTYVPFATVDGLLIDDASNGSFYYDNTISTLYVQNVATATVTGAFSGSATISSLIYTEWVYTGTGGYLKVDDTGAMGIRDFVPIERWYTAYASPTVANSSAETSLLSGSYAGFNTANAYTFQYGSGYRLKLKGVYSAIATPGNATVKVKLGSAVVAQVTITNLLALASNRYFEIDVDIAGRTAGAPGTVMTSGKILFESAAGVPSIGALDNAGATTGVFTTISNVIDVTWTWATANVGNTISCTVATIEKIN